MTGDVVPQVHRVHAVRRQRVGAGPACAVPRRAAPRAAPPSRPGARRAAAQRHCPGEIRFTILIRMLVIAIDVQQKPT